MDRMESENYICRDGEGNILISVERMEEAALSADPLFTHCLAVVKAGDEYLLGKNKWRNRYEVFGGCAEKGETARECIMRECGEELGCAPSDIIWLGAMRLLMKPDYFSPHERMELGGLYGVVLPDTKIGDLYARIKDRDEITGLAWYSQVKGREPIACIDEKLLEYFA